MIVIKGEVVQIKYYSLILIDAINYWVCKVTFFLVQELYI